jgi:hypothetical protein
VGIWGYRGNLGVPPREGIIELDTDTTLGHIRYRMKQPTTVLLELSKTDYAVLKAQAEKADRSIRAQVRHIVANALKCTK